MNFQPLKDFLDYYLPMLGVPGSDTVVYKDHQEVFRYQSGFDNIKLRTPVKKDALYNIYGCSRLALCVAATQLIERGEIVITDPLYAYFPEYRNMEIAVKDENGSFLGYKKAEKPILLKHLLTMTSGMSVSYSSPAVRNIVESAGGKALTVEVCRALANEPIDFEPGADYLESISHDVFAGVIELVSGMRFADYMRENVFLPLGMNETSYHINPAKVYRMASQYDFDTTAHAPVEISAEACEARLGSEYDSGSAGIVTSVNDYILLADALASGGVGKSGNRILSSYGVKLLSSNMFNDAQLERFGVNQNIGYGYGYGVRVNLHPEIAGSIAPYGEISCDGDKLSYVSADLSEGISVFHAEHMGGLHRVVIPRLRNLIYSCIED